MHLSREENCRSLRCSWIIACRRCSNYIFILDLTSGFKGFGKDSRKTIWESFKCWDLVCLILETWRYVFVLSENVACKGLRPISQSGIPQKYAFVLASINIVLLGSTNIVSKLGKWIPIELLVKMFCTSSCEFNIFILLPATVLVNLIYLSYIPANVVQNTACYHYLWCPVWAERHRASCVWQTPGNVIQVLSSVITPYI